MIGTIANTSKFFCYLFKLIKQSNELLAKKNKISTWKKVSSLKKNFKVQI